MLEKLKNLLRSANEFGIPIPYLKDPVSKKASVTLTMFVVAFTITILATIGKITKVLDFDSTAMLTLYVTSGGFYLGRGFREDHGKIEVQKEK
jgi:hypothetical protein